MLINRINLGFIVPIPHLKYSTQGDFLYVLAHKLDNKQYYSFTKNSSMYKILDNSVHEQKEIDMDSFYDNAIKLEIDEIVLQDYMDNYQKTLQLKNKQLNERYDELDSNEIKIMAALQGKTMNQLIKLYDDYSEDDRIDVIGLSFTLIVKDFTKDKYLNQYMNRLLILDKLTNHITKEHNFVSKPLHLLGANTWFEALLQNQYPHIRSNDTKLLSRLARGYCKLGDVSLGKPSTKLTLDEKFDKEQLNILQENITIMKKLIQ